MTKLVAITTIDNPYDPLDDFERWHAYDVEKGYHSASLLARISFIPSDLPENLHLEFLELAIDEMVEMNTTGLYKKVTRFA